MTEKENKKEILEGIKRGLQDVKEGKVNTLEETKKKLNINK